MVTVLPKALQRDLGLYMPLSGPGSSPITRRSGVAWRAWWGWGGKKAQGHPFVKAAPANWAVFLIVDRARAEKIIILFTLILRLHLSEIMKEEKAGL